MGDRHPPYPSPPEVMWEQCPIATTLGSLGRKWTIPILRDVAFVPKVSFGWIRRHNPGLRQRTLSNRLQELSEEGLIRRIVPPVDRRHPYYELTQKGLEVWPILSSLFQYGIRQHARTIFADGRPRDIAEIYPRDAELMLGTLASYARTINPGTSARLSTRPPQGTSPARR